MVTDAGEASTARSWARVGWVDGILAALVLVVMVGTTFAASNHHEVHDPWSPFAVALLLIAPAALVFRRRDPVAVLAVTLAAALTYALAGYGQGPLFVPLVIALVTAVLFGHRRAAVAALVIGYVGFLWVRPLVGVGDWPTLAGSLGLAAWLLVLFAIGEGIRSRRVQAWERAQVREAQARRAVSEERLRIAREVHDLVAHNISLINVQAATTLHRADRGDASPYEALATIKAVSQRTLVELRSLLGALREDGEAAPRAPAPSLTRLDELVASAAAAGVDAHVEVRGEPRELAASMDLAAYRIVQEGLTNVVRHAATSNASVRVVYGDDDVVIEVDDDGAVAVPVVAGTGITGMSERAHALGGNLQAGPRPGGGFRVRAWLPEHSDR